MTPEAVTAARTVDELLVRYDEVVSALAADPGALLRPGDPAVSGLDAVVDAGSVLGADIRSSVGARLGRNEVVEAPPGTRSYVHHASDISDTSGDVISFTWCGWSPGVARDAASRAVVDDSVGHAVGTGTIARTAGTWRIRALDQTSLEVLPPGSPDPCARRDVVTAQGTS